MVQTTIDLDHELSNFVEIFKAHKNLKSKNEAIRVIITEYKELKKEEFMDRLLVMESSILSEKALAKSWLSEEDEEAFAYLQEE